MRHAKPKDNRHAFADATYQPQSHPYHQKYQKSSEPKSCPRPVNSARRRSSKRQNDARMSRKLDIAQEQIVPVLVPPASNCSTITHGAPAHRSISHGCRYEEMNLELLASGPTVFNGLISATTRRHWVLAIVHNQQQDSRPSRSETLGRPRGRCFVAVLTVVKPRTWGPLRESLVFPQLACYRCMLACVRKCAP